MERAKGTLWPLNTSFQADLKPVLWSGFYYLLAADETKERQVYKLDLEKMTYLPFEKMKKEKILVYPNPSQEYVEWKGEKKFTLSGLIDIAGKEWKIASHDNRLDIRMLPANVYVLLLTDENGMHCQVSFVKM